MTVYILSERSLRKHKKIMLDKIKKNNPTMINLNFLKKILIDVGIFLIILLLILFSISL